MNSNEVFRETNLMFLGTNSDNNFIITDMVNFGFLSIFPFFSKLLEININIVISIFFLAIFLISLALTILSVIILTKNKVKKIFLITLTLFIYYILYEIILIKHAEYFIYFFWGILPISTFLIFKLSRKYIFILLLLYSFLIPLLGSLVYFSFLGFFIFLNLIILSLDTNIKIKIKYLTFPYFAVLILYFFTELSNNYSQINLKKIDPTAEVKILRNVGNNLIPTLYAGMGFINSDNFKREFSDNEILKLIGKVDANENKIIKNSIRNQTQITNTDIQILKKKILNIVLENPLFIFRLYTAKIGVLIGYFIVICNISLIFFFLNIKKNIFGVPLLFNLFFSSLFPIISIPSFIYSLPFIASSISIYYFSIIFNKKLI